jgi:hypothetical protein
MLQIVGWVGGKIVIPMSEALRAADKNLKHFEQCMEKQPCIWRVILVFLYVPKVIKMAK